MNQSYHQNPSWLKGAWQTPNNFWGMVAKYWNQPWEYLYYVHQFLTEVYSIPNRYDFWKIIWYLSMEYSAYPSFMIAFREFPSLFTYVQRFVSECYVAPKKVLQDFMYSVVLLWLIWRVIIFRVMCII